MLAGYRSNEKSGIQELIIEFGILFMRRSQLILNLLVVLVLVVSNLHNASAVGAYPDPQVITQSDGSQLTIQMHGDEWFNWIATIDGYRIVRNKSGVFEYATVLKAGDIVASGIKVSEISSRSIDENTFLQTITKGPRVSSEAITEIRRDAKSGVLKSSTVSTYFPTKGKPSLLVILANFSDTNTTYLQEDFDRYMNENGYNSTGSFKDYYLENSLGQLEISSVVTAWVQLPKTHDYYGPRAKWGEFAYASVQAASEQGIDFSLFDNDGDGVVEGIAIIHQGPGQEVTSDETDIWSHSWSLASAGYSLSARTFNGVVVNQYTTQPETRNASGAMNTIGVMCHEFGHNLGAPDFYDTNDDEGGSYLGTGRWDLMALGSYNGVPLGSMPAHHNPFTKISYNWTSATLIDEPTSHVLDPVLSTGQIYRINSPVTNEYILLENRQRTGFDTALPGKGLLAYHVDENWINTYWASNEINVSEHQGLYPIAAGGIINVSSCPFPGSIAITQLTDETNPAMATWSGEGFNRSISGITEADGVIYFDFMAFQNGSPLELLVEEVSSSSLRVIWTPADVALPVLLAWSENGVFGTPGDGVSYTSGSTITGGGEVLYYGSALTEFLHENLTVSTKYYYSVWGEKDGTWTSPLKSSGITSSVPISVFPWVESFEEGINIWEQELVSGEYPWIERTQGINDKPVSAFVGESFASFYAATNSVPVVRLISPTLELNSTAEYALEFRHYQAKWDESQDVLRVLVKKESATEWEELALYNENEEEWIQRYIPIPYSEHVKIAFEATGNYGYGIAIDTVVVKQLSGCTPPTSSVSSVNATDTSLTGMTLNWTNSQGDGVLVVARKGAKVLDLPQSGTSYTASSNFGDGDLFGTDSYVVYSGNGNSVALSNLDHSSYYYFSLFTYNSGDLCYYMEPERFVSPTEMKVYTFTVEVTDGLAPLVDADVILDGILQVTDENGMAEWQIAHRNEYASLSVSYLGKETKWSKVALNNSKEIKVVLEALIPMAPTEITHIKDYKTVTLNWNPVIDENFDNHKPFDTSISGWVFDDKDQTQTYELDGVDFDNEGYTGSYIVLDAHSEALLQAGNGFNAYSGRQVLGCVAANGSANNDWIISPVFTVQDGDNLSFMARSYTDNWGLEKFNVLVSVQEPSPQTFINISGGIQQVPIIWTSYAYALQDYVGKKVTVAIQCISNDAFILLLDKIKVGPGTVSPSEVVISNDGPQLSISKNKAVSRSHYETKSALQISPVDIAPNVGPIGYSVLLGGEVVGILNGFSQNSIVAEVQHCTDNLFSVKTNYLVESVSSDWVDYAAETCYSVTFSVKNPQLMPIVGANISVDGRLLVTDAEGFATSEGFELVADMPYYISKDGFKTFNGTFSITTSDKEIDVVLTLNSDNENLLNGSEITLYPNPASNEIVICGVLSGMVDIRMYDLGGRLVKSVENTGGSDLNIDLYGITPGVYMIVLQQQNDVWRQKLVVIR